MRQPSGFPPTQCTALASTISLPGEDHRSEISRVQDLLQSNASNKDRLVLDCYYRAPLDGAFQDDDLLSRGLSREILLHVLEQTRIQPAASGQDLVPIGILGEMLDSHACNTVSRNSNRRERHATSFRFSASGFA